MIWIGKFQVGKSPLSYTLSAVMSAFWIIQDNKEDAEEPGFLTINSLTLTGRLLMSVLVMCFVASIQGFQTCSHLDYFRKERGRRTKPRVLDDGNLNLEYPASVKAVTEVSGIDRKTMARHNASSYERNQLCQICSNPYDRSAEPPMAAGVYSDLVSFEAFFKVVRPSFHREFDEEDLIGVFKRAAIIVFTEICIYIRLPGTDRKPSKRYAWPDSDHGAVSLCARPTLAAYKKGNLKAQPPNFSEDMQWSLNLLQTALDGEALEFTTVRGTGPFTGKKYLEEKRPTLAGISGTTKYVFEQEDEANRSQTTRRFKRVASSSALLPPAACPKKEEEDDAASSANRARAAPALAQ